MKVLMELEWMRVIVVRILTEKYRTPVVVDFNTVEIRMQEVVILSAGEDFHKDHFINNLERLNN